MAAASSYTATKASVDAISSVLSKELAPREIRVNAVNPGMIAGTGIGRLRAIFENLR